jgi:hypothetical protein
MKLTDIDDLIEGSWYFTYFRDPKFGTKLIGVMKCAPERTKWDNPYGEFHECAIQYFISHIQDTREVVIEDHVDADYFISRVNKDCYTFWELGEDEILTHAVIESL